MNEIPKILKLDTLKNIRKNLNNPIPFIVNQSNKLGDIYAMPHGSIDAIVLTKPEYVQHVLQKNHKNYYKSPIQTEQLGEFIGKGLLTSNGDYWLKQRRLVQPGFHIKKLRNITHLMFKEVNSISEKLKNYAGENKVVELKDLMAEITFKIISKSIFSDDILEEDIIKLSDTIETVQQYFIKTLRMPYLKWYFNLSGLHKKHKDIVLETDKIIKSQIKKRQQSKKEKDDLLDMLINVKYEDTNEGMSIDQIKDEVAIIFAAGHETSANALTWLFYLLSEHPEILKKVRAESEEVLGDFNKNEPTFETVNQLKYTKQVIQEVLRMYPPAWILDRIALEKDEIDGYDIPKKSVVFLCIYAIHHNKDIWENPEKFDPDRFEGDRAKKMGNYKYFPFGGGPRLCVGNNFAIMEMQLVVAMLSQTFDFEMLNKQKVDIKALITLQAKQSLNMKIKLRNPF